MVPPCFRREPQCCGECAKDVTRLCLTRVSVIAWGWWALDGPSSLARGSWPLPDLVPPFGGLDGFGVLGGPFWTFGASERCVVISRIRQSNALSVRIVVV